MTTLRSKINTMSDTPAFPRMGPLATAILSVRKAIIGALAFLLLASGASAAPFSFSTGNPDGKIATLSRPPGPGKIQTETADDFVVTQAVVISQATFTGLVPLGTALGSISGVEIEIYHVFPFDSVIPPSGNVPNRTNSPADVEIDSATRDSADGSLAFSATIVSASFTASNSVVNGINKHPGERTNGEGAVTGEEVMITVNFNPPIALPADHYFFRPEVSLTSGDFLWLSAPKPIVAPGTPFTFGTDLQSWIRNDALDPDWLRIGTDITGQGPFNAAFSLTGETDADADGVPDSLDQCPGTPTGAIVDANGCSIEQLVPCRGPASGGTWKNHGQYVSAFAKAVAAFVAQDLITEEQAEKIVSEAAESDCGSASKRVVGPSKKFGTTSRLIFSHP
jgi:hypothetical protein